MGENHPSTKQSQRSEQHIKITSNHVQQCGEADEVHTTELNKPHQRPKAVQPTNKGTSKCQVPLNRPKSAKKTRRNSNKQKAGKRSTSTCKHKKVKRRGPATKNRGIASSTDTKRGARTLINQNTKGVSRRMMTQKRKRYKIKPKQKEKRDKKEN